jgi:type I restriction enzyme S subunit
MGKRQSPQKDSIVETAFPLDWQISTIGNEVVFTRKPIDLKIHDGKEVPFIPMDLLPSEGLQTKQFIFRKGSELTSGVFFNEGDLLLAKITPCLENGKQAIATGIPGGWGYATTEVFPIRPNRVVIDFLAFYLRNPSVRQELASKMQGATGRQRVPREVLEKFPIPVPPIPEQQAIAEVLGRVQRAKEATEKVIAACRQLKQSLMRHLFTYGPVPIDQADKVELKELDYGTVPKSWKTLPLSDCSHVQTGVAKGRQLNTIDTITVPYLRVANVQDGFLDLREIKKITIRPNELLRFSLKSGDLLLTEGGDFDKLGRGFLWQGQLPVCVHQNHIFAVRARQDKLLPDFLAYLTQSPYGKSYFLTVAHRTTNLACINTTKLKALPVLLPPMKDQHAIVGTLGMLDCKIQKEEQRRVAIITFFNTLIQHLMTGKIRV